MKEPVAAAFGDVRIESGDRRVSARLPDAGHSVFEGHFDGEPLLPGWCQLAFVARAAREIGCARSGMRGVRFKRPILPGASISVTFTPLGDATRFELTAAGTMAAAGQLVRVTRPPDESDRSIAPSSETVDVPGPPPNLPHTQRALMLRDVLERSDDAARCRCSIDAAHPLVERGEAPAEVLMEFGAQAAAALGAADDVGGPARIVGLRELRSEVHTIPADVPHEVHVTDAGSAAPLRNTRFEVRGVGSGTVSVWSEARSR